MNKEKYNEAKGITDKIFSEAEKSAKESGLCHSRENELAYIIGQLQTTITKLLTSEKYKQHLLEFYSS